MLVVDALEYHAWNRGIFEDIKAGGIDCVNATCCIWENAREALDNIAMWQRLYEEHADLIAPARSVADIYAAKAAGRASMVLGFQSASPYEHDIGLVGVFAALGVKIVQLTYNGQNHVGASCYEEVDPGLSWFGREVVAEMNKHRVLIDLSHVGERTSFDSIERSGVPVAITHANPKFAKEARRNKSDALIKALAARGGVIGVAVESGMLPGGARTTITEFCDMVAKLVEMVGVEHVGIGSDHNLDHSHEARRWWLVGKWTRNVPGFVDLVPTGWEGEELGFPEWITKPSGVANIIDGLRARGFTEAEVEAIAGGNWLRIFKEAWGE